MTERLNKFQFWCQKVLPLVYDDSLSYYELLCKVVEILNQAISNQNSIRDILAIHENDIFNLKEDVKLLENEIEKIKAGGYLSVYIESLSKWIDENLQELVSKIAKFVMFGLSDDGHFIAIIPDSWSEITFDTSENGELILIY